MTNHFIECWAQLEVMNDSIPSAYPAPSHCQSEKIHCDINLYFPEDTPEHFRHPIPWKLIQATPNLRKRQGLDVVLLAVLSHASEGGAEGLVGGLVEATPLSDLGQKISSYHAHHGKSTPSVQTFELWSPDIIAFQWCKLRSAVTKSCDSQFKRLAV